VLAKTRQPPAHVVVDDGDAFALTGDSGERSWHVEHVPAREAGDSTLVAASAIPRTPRASNDHPDRAVRV
jgi:hypothetical protein